MTLDDPEAIYFGHDEAELLNGAVLVLNYHHDGESHWCTPEQAIYRIEEILDGLKPEDEWGPRMEAMGIIPYGAWWKRIAKAVSEALALCDKTLSWAYGLYTKTVSEAYDHYNKVIAEAYNLYIKTIDDARVLYTKTCSEAWSSHQHPAPIPAESWAAEFKEAEP